MRRRRLSTWNNESGYVVIFFFNDTATTEIYTLSLHDALPISRKGMFDIADVAHAATPVLEAKAGRSARMVQGMRFQDRKSTRLNSSHANISYAVFCLK